jgi:hypothetical protein
LAIYENKLKQYKEKKKEIEELKEAGKYNNQHISDEKLSNGYQVKGLGWTSIDRFYYDSRIATNDLKVNIENKNDNELVYVSLLMKNQNLYISAFQNKDRTYGLSHYDAEPTNLPIGEEAIITATTYNKDILYFAFQKIIIDKK